MAQWIRVHLTMQGMPDSVSLIWKIPHATERWNPLATSAEPECCDYWSLCTTHVGLSQPNKCYVIFLKNVYKNYDLFLAYKTNIAIFLFLLMNCTCWKHVETVHVESCIGFGCLICINCSVLSKKKLPLGTEMFNSGRTNYGKSITILFRYVW